MKNCIVGGLFTCPIILKDFDYNKTPCYVRPFVFLNSTGIGN